MKNEEYLFPTEEEYFKELAYIYAMKEQEEKEFFENQRKPAKIEVKQSKLKDYDRGGDIHQITHISF
jgi:hypothetical protein